MNLLDMTGEVAVDHAWSGAATRVCAQCLDPNIIVCRLCNRDLYSARAPALGLGLIMSLTSRQIALIFENIVWPDSVDGFFPRLIAKTPTPPKQNSIPSLIVKRFGWNVKSQKKNANNRRF